MNSNETRIHGLNGRLEFLPAFLLALLFRQKGMKVELRVIIAGLNFTLRGNGGRLILVKQINTAPWQQRVDF